MLKTYFVGTATRVSALAIALASATLAVATLAPTRADAQAANHEITVTIIRVKALDKADDLSADDFFARVTIDGDVQNSAVINDKNEIKPDWKLAKKVTAGKHTVKLEIIDKDVAEDDPIDINKVGKKRSLEFTVDTDSCKIEGFSQGYSCGEKITREGAEKKKAEVTFKVDVKK